MRMIAEEIRVRYFNNLCSIPPLPKNVQDILSWSELEKLLEEFEEMKLKRKNILKKVSDLAEELCKE